ncbi:MAG: hypothetical protein AB7S26_38535 [Sandaracinaceae bacterium]
MANGSARAGALARLFTLALVGGMVGGLVGGMVGCGGCPEGTHSAGDRCVADEDGGLDAAVRDAAGIDAAGRDAADVDAAACGVACESPTPYCDAASGDCVECLANADCATGVCEANACVDCRSDADCPASAPECDADACVSCRGRTDCTPLQIVLEARSLACACLIQNENVFASETNPSAESLEAAVCHAWDPDVGSSLSAYVFSAVLDGRITLDLDEVARCGSVLAQLRDTPGDRPMFPGVVPQLGAAEPCRFDFECAGGICDTSLSCPGACTPRAGLPCTGGCGIDQDCDLATSRCVPAPGDGEPCRIACQPGLICDAGGPLDDLCQPIPNEGDPCTPNDGRCAAGLVCDGSNRCTGAAQGQSCGLTRRCAAGLACDNFMCQPARAEGVSCTTSGQCDVGLRCASGTCRRIAAPGEACGATVVCPFGLGCSAAGTCDALPDLGDPCTDRCLRGTCRSGTCRQLDADTPCTHPSQPPDYWWFEALDECGAEMSCVDDGTFRCFLYSSTCPGSPLCDVGQQCVAASCVDSPCLAL